MSSESILDDHLAETNESAKLILQNVKKISQLSSQFKHETKLYENNLDTLNKLVFQAGKDVTSLQNCLDSFLLVAKNLVYVSLEMVPVGDPNFNTFKEEANKLLNILDDITEDEDQFENKLKSTFNRAHSNSIKCLNINEKYPDRCSRESLLDISNIVSLPTVPEDVFADFSRPRRTMSSSSLKNMRRVKMCLQKMSDDDIDTTSAKPYLASSVTSVS